MAHHTCPFWVGYLLCCPLRKFPHNPRKIFGPHVAAGMRVLDVGCAMGFFSLPLAEMVGAAGKVICVDVQAKMLGTLGRRALKAGLAERIEPRLCGFDSLRLEDQTESIDFALAFAVVHEVNDPGRFFTEINRAMKPSASLLFAEPILHVSHKKFSESLNIALQHQWRIVRPLRIPRCRAALLSKLEGYKQK